MAPAPARYGSFDSAPSVARKDIAPPPSNAGKASVERDMTASVRKQEAVKSWDAGFAKAPSVKDTVTSVPTSRPSTWHAGDAPPSYKTATAPSSASNDPAYQYRAPRTTSVPQQTERVVVRETSSSNDMLLGYMLGRAASPSHAPVIVNGGGYQSQPNAAQLPQGTVGQPMSVPSNASAASAKEEESSWSWVWWLLGIVVLGLGAYAVYLQLQNSPPAKRKREANYKLSW